MHHSKSSGFTLIELMIVLAIIGILASVATPEYLKYSKRAKFVGVVMETVKFKTAAEAAYQLGFDDLSELSSGKYGIPEKIDAASSNKPVSDVVSTVEIDGGTITAVGTDIVDNANYKIVASAHNKGLKWTVSSTSTCLSKGFCSQN